MFLRKSSGVNQSKNTVILVHGINDTALKMRHLGWHLSNLGWSVYAISLSPSSGKIGIGKMAEQLKKFIDKNAKTDTKVDLVGFSMGGLVCRYYIQRLGGIQKTERLITLSTPHHGTWMANFIDNTGCIEMRRNSEFLQSLNSDLDVCVKLKITSVYTPFDLMILPTTSSHLQFAKNVRVPILLHPLMVRDGACLKIVETELLR